MEKQIPKAYPPFHDLRLRHGISLEMLSEFAKRTICWEAIQQFDETGRADPYTADDLLFALSELTGETYTRSNVGGIIFVLARPPASPTRPELRPGMLPAQPTLVDLFVAYHLDIDWVGEALRLDDDVIWNILEAPVEERDRSIIEQFLHLVSRPFAFCHGRRLVQRLY